MTDNMRPNPSSLWKAYRIPRGTSTVAMKGGNVRFGNEFDFLAGDDFSEASEPDRQEPVLPDNWIGMFRKVLQDLSMSKAKKSWIGSQRTFASSDVESQGKLHSPICRKEQRRRDRYKLQQLHPRR